MIKKSLRILMFSFSTALVSSALFISGAADPMDTEPSLSQLGAIFGRIFNTALFVAGGVLVIMIAYGVWKSAMATGDPRGLEGAKQTWSYAIYGFFVIVLFFALFLIITSIFGIKSLNSPGIFIKNAFSAIEELVSLPAK